MLKKILHRTKRLPVHSTRAPRDIAADALHSFLGALSEKPAARDMIEKEIGAAAPADLARIAKRHIKTVRVLTGMHDLLEALQRGPVLVQWRDPELGRFQYTVFYAQSEGMLFLLDPVWGKRRVAQDIFERNWMTNAKKTPWALGLTL